MPGIKRESSQLARDRRRIADLYLKGWIQADIADELGMSQPTVSRDIKVLQKQWLASSLVDIDKAKARELARVDRVEREHWDAWERSQEDAETVTTKGAEEDGELLQVHERTVQLKGQTGDPRFLAGVQWCIEQRCRILGLNAPEKRDITSSGKAISIREVVIELPPDEPVED